MLATTHPVDVGLLEPVPIPILNLNMRRSRAGGSSSAALFLASTMVLCISVIHVNVRMCAHPCSPRIRSINVLHANRISLHRNRLTPVAEDEY
jgi:hypothetical protein